MKVKFISERAQPTLIMTAGSFIALVAIFVLTNPYSSAAMVIAFFAIFFIFLISFLNLVSMLSTGTLSVFARRRIMLVATFISVFLMFSSTRSLSLTDVIILFLIVFGLYFYLKKS